MELLLLADAPEMIETIAQWHYDQWGRADPRMTFERVLAKVSASVERTTAPMMVLARENGVVVGTAQLKFRELDLDPDFDYWLGSVYVVPEHRGRGVASLLVAEVLDRARAAGIEHLYLQTEDLSGGLYRRHGFEPLREIEDIQYRALLMVARLAP